MKKYITAVICCLTALGASAQTNRVAPEIVVRRIPGTNDPARDRNTWSLDQALAIYGEAKGRALLRHPQLKEARMPFANGESREKMVSTIEAHLFQQGITTMPLGEKFIMIVPVALTNDLPLPPIPSDSSVTNRQKSSSGMLNFQNAPLAQVFAVFGALNQKLVVNASEMSSLPGQITFQSNIPLQRSEVVYALETLLVWNGIKIVPIDDKTCKAVAIRTK